QPALFAAHSVAPHACTLDSARRRQPGSGTRRTPCARTAGRAQSSPDRDAGNRSCRNASTGRSPDAGLASDFVDGDAVDHDVFDRLVTGILLHGLDLLDDGLRLLVFDLAEDGVLALEPGGGDGRDEELRTVRSTAHLDAGIGHGENVWLGEVQLRVDLVVKLVAGATGALPERVAALDHEVVDDAVEDHAVVQRV